MSRQKNSLHDTPWPEVVRINSYATFMGYLMMGVRGLGLLVLTWTTVVLLGGFVSMLQKKDFWCLTAITLVQTAGVFDFLLKEKASDVGNSLMGLLSAVSAAVMMRPFKKDTKTPANSSKIIKEDNEPSIAHFVVGVVLFIVQLLVLGIILCPLAVLYVLGLYLSAGISLWRLIQHDYGNPPDGGANLKPALNVLYSLAVAQGGVYGYRTIYDLAARTGLVKDVAKDYSLEVDLVSKYLDETMEGCMKDPSFAKGRNLVTYAVYLLMESKLSYSYLSGVLILGRVTLKKRWQDDGQLGLMKQLLTGSTSFSHVVQRLVETFGPASPYNTEIRMQAARIVATVAGSIRLHHFPAQGMMMIQSVSSLLDAFEEYSWQPEGYDERPGSSDPGEDWYERAWLLDDGEVWYLDDIDENPSPKVADSNIQDYKGLVVQGLRILQGLAANEDNCRVISNAEGLLYKTISPLLSDRLHSGDHHDEWYSMAEESLIFLKRFMAVPYPGETETKLRKEISGYSQVIISALKGILDCLKCQVPLKRQAVEVLLDLSAVDTAHFSIMSAGSSSTMFLWIVLHISLVRFTMCGSTHFVKKSICIGSLAGEKLQAMLSEMEASATSTLRSVADLICSLATTVADAQNNAYIRTHAATILRDLVRYYTKDDENLKQLKTAMTDVMPEVLIQIVVYARGTREAGVQAATEANNDGKVLLAEGPDLEQGGVPHGNNGQESCSTPYELQHQGIQLQKVLVDLCEAINNAWIPKDQDLTGQFNEIAAKICSRQGMSDMTFERIVREAFFVKCLEERRARLAAVGTS